MDSGSSSRPLRHDSIPVPERKLNFDPAQPPSTQIITTRTNILKSRIQRRSTTRARQYDRDEHGDQPLPSTDLHSRSTVYDAIITRMQAAKISTVTLNQFSLAWCLPKKNSDHFLWTDLLDGAIFVSDAELSGMIRLRPSTATSPLPAENETIYYIRSFAFSAAELSDVIQYLFAKGDYHQKAFAWLEYLHNMDSDTPVFIRYCGTSSSTSGWGRHRHDMRSKSGSAWIRILQTALLLYPEVVNNACVFELPEAAVRFQVADEISDLREQVLIALMGRETLLNVQKGGKQTHLSMSREQADEAEILNTTTVRSLRQRTKACPTEIQLAVGRYADAVQTYANANPFSTGTATFAFLDEYRDVMYNQALPTMFGKYNIMVTIGQNPPITDFSAATPFFEGEGFSARLTRTMINAIGSMESGTGVVDQMLAKQLHAEHHLPFIDLFQWCKISGQDLPAAMGFAREYLSATSPLIAMTYGYQASSAALGCFTHDFGIRRGDFASLVGSLRISTYNEPGAVHSDENCVVVIPSYHPSAISYSPTAVDAFVEVFGKTVAITWLAMSVALATSGSSKREICQKIVDRVKLSVGPTTAFGIGLEKSKRLLFESHRSMNFAPRSQSKATAQRKAKAAAKGKGPAKDKAWDDRHDHDRYQRFSFDFEKDGIKIKSDAQRWKFGKDELAMVVRCEKAIGKPNTAARREQAIRLWQSAIAPLMTEKTGTTQQGFIRWIERRPVDDMYYFSAAISSDQIRDIPNLLSLHLPHTVQDPNSEEWLEDENLVRQATLSLRTWMEEAIYKGNVSSDKIVLHSANAWARLMDKKDPTLRSALRSIIIEKVDKADRQFTDQSARISGSEVDIVPWKTTAASAALKLHWKDNAGQMQHLEGHGRWNRELCLPAAAMPTYEDDIRLIYFVRDGIDIRDSEGISLGRRTASCTVPLRDILLQLEEPMKEKLLELWSRETGLGLDTVMFGSVPAPSPTKAGTSKAFPTSAYQGKRANEAMNVGARGHQITEKTERQKIQNYLPLQAGDALWLLHRFLEDAYPDGGEIDIANPTFFPSAPSMWPRLDAFCQKPEYRFHPHALSLRSIAGTAVEEANTAGCDTSLKVALGFLRPPVERKRFRSYVKELKKQKWKVIYTVGNQAPAHVVPPGLNPVLERDDEILEEVEDDAMVGADGELVEREGSGPLEDVEKVSESSLERFDDSQPSRVAESPPITPDETKTEGAGPSRKRDIPDDSDKEEGSDHDEDDDDDEPNRRSSRPPEKIRTRGALGGRK